MTKRGKRSFKAIGLSLFHLSERSDCFCISPLDILMDTSHSIQRTSFLSSSNQCFCQCFLLCPHHFSNQKLSVIHRNNVEGGDWRKESLERELGTSSQKTLCDVLRLFSVDSCVLFLISHFFINFPRFELRPPHSTLNFLSKAPIIFASPIHGKGFIQTVYTRGVSSWSISDVSLYPIAPCFKLNIFKIKYFPKLTLFQLHHLGNEQWWRLLASSQDLNSSSFIFLSFRLETESASTVGGIIESLAGYKST